MQTRDEIRAERVFLEPGEYIPNHPQWPVLWYRGTLARDDPEGEARRLLERNGWVAEWTGGIYDYHHYHTTAHEFLAIIAGSAIVRLGGYDGVDLSVDAGDAIVLPAGTGHRVRDHSPAFRVLAAYPQGQHWDLLQEDQPLTGLIRARIAEVPRPARDPLAGDGGPLVDAWS